MRLKDNNNPFIHVNPPYQLMVIHSSKLVYPHELYQRGVERKRVELIAAHFNEYCGQNCGQNQMRPAHKQKNPTISNVKSFDL